MQANDKIKIDYYYNQCLSDTKEESFGKLENNKNSLQKWQYTLLQAQLNTYFQPKVKDPTVEPIQWDWNGMNDFPNVEWVIKSLGISPGPITILCAFVNTGKTLFAADLAVCVANGIPLFNTIEVQAPGKVMHIDFESGNTMCKIYYQRLLNGHGIQNFNNISFFQPRWKLDEEEARESLIKVLKDHKLCIIDCLSAGIPSTKQNEEGARAPLDMLNEVSEKTGCAIVLLHHEPKIAGDDPLRSVKGSGAIIAAAGNSLHLHRDFGSSECTIKRGKKRLGKDFSATYTLESVGDYIEQLDDTAGCKFVTVIKEDNNPDSLNAKILTLIKASPGINKRAILHQVSGCRNEEKETALEKLLQDQQIRIEPSGKTKKHFITSDGESWLAYNSKTGESK